VVGIMCGFAGQNTHHKPKIGGNGDATGERRVSVG
jgi:hypothetical protein